MSGYSVDTHLIVIFEKKFWLDKARKMNKMKGFLGSLYSLLYFSLLLNIKDSHFKSKKIHLKKF